MSKLVRLQKAVSVAVLCTLGAAAQAEGRQPVPDNDYWWPNRLSLEPLRDSAASANPLGADFNYAEAVKDLDVEALKQDLKKLMRTSQD